MKHRRTVLRLAVAAAALVVAVGGAARGVQPFAGWLYQLAWFPLLVTADALLALRLGSSPLLGRGRFAVHLFLWSVPFWFLFEIANIRLANWYYVFLPHEGWVRWTGSILAFSTVLPALYLAHAWMESAGVGAGWRGRPFSVRPAHRRSLLALGVSFVGLSMWRPEIFFPLVWGSVTLLLEPGNHRRDPSRSLLGDLSSGRYARIGQLLAGGLCVGIAWETLNSVAAARWIYTVPGLEEWKVFEMPVPGFLGFPVLALDAYVLYQALVLGGLAPDGWSGHARPRVAVHRSAVRRALAVFAGLVICATALTGADRYTVDSFRPRLGSLSGVTPSVEGRLRDAGFRSVAAVASGSPSALAAAAGLAPGSASRLIEAARLAMLRGIGTEHGRALAAAGLRSICELAGAEPRAVTAAVRRADQRPNAGRPARVRAWLTAARSACPEGSAAGPCPPATADGSCPRQPARRIPAQGVRGVTIHVADRLGAEAR